MLRIIILYLGPSDLAVFFLFIWINYGRLTFVEFKYLIVFVKLQVVLTLVYAN